MAAGLRHRLGHHHAVPHGPAPLTGTGYDKVAADAPRHLQAVRGYLIDILTRGELRSLAAIGDRAHDPASFAFRRATLRATARLPLGTTSSSVSGRETVTHTPPRRMPPSQPLPGVIRKTEQTRR